MSIFVDAMRVIYFSALAGKIEYEDLNKVKARIHYNIASPIIMPLTLTRFEINSRLNFSRFSSSRLMTFPQFSGGAPGQFAWQGGEMIMTYKDGTSVAIETNQGQGNEEVEVMSTDSSSSSSTDSN